MQTWILFTLATTFLWALGNVLDQIGIRRYVKNEYRYSYWYYLARLPIAFFCFFIWGVIVPSNTIMWLTILSGFITAIPFVLYYRVLKSVEAYSVALVYVSLHPLCTYIISSIFLPDVLSRNEIIGFSILLIAGVLSVLRFDKKITVKKELLWMIPTTLIWSLGDVLFDYIIPFYDGPAQSLAWIALGGFLTALLYKVVPSLRKRCTDSSSIVPYRGYIVFFITLILVFVSYFTFLSALQFGNIALTSALTASQPLIVFIFEIIAGFYIKIQKRVPYTWEVIAPKSLALVCAVVGVYLISL